MKKILSIDGGGVKGVFPASFLATIEDQIGDRVATYFDLIVGTSTGGIIALGLGLGFSAKEMCAFYEEWGPKIFKSSRSSSLFGFIRSKYGSTDLHSGLTKIFQDQLLGHSRTRLVIPSLNLENGTVHLYKTAHHERFEMDYRVPVVEVARATSAAPTYFPTFRSSQDVPYIDGGVWANNPIAVAAVEALTILGWSADDVQVLSLSCTNTPLDIGFGRNWALGRSYWAFKMVDVFMTGQSNAALGMAQHLLGKPAITRIEPTLAKGKFSLDDARCINDLKGLGYTEARKTLPELRSKFFSEKANDFQPFHHL